MDEADDFEEGGDNYDPMAMPEGVNINGSAAQSRAQSRAQSEKGGGGLKNALNARLLKEMESAGAAKSRVASADLQNHNNEMLALQHKLDGIVDPANQVQQQVDAAM